MNLAHEADFIRLSDTRQASFYPYFVEAFELPIWHKSDMAFSFDKDLVKAEMKRQRITQAQLANAAGLTAQSAVAKIFTGERQVKVEEAARIYALLKLIPGGAEPVKTVPIIGLTSAGNWREAMAVPIGSMSIPRAIGSDQAFAIEVKGDSMDLLIDDGGYVLIDPTQTQLYDGKIYLIENSEYETTVKRYRGNPARFCPMSTNPEHTEFELGKGHYRVIGRVVWKGGVVD